MEERIIIKSEYDKKALKFLSILKTLLIIVAVFSFFSAFLEWDQDCSMWASMIKYDTVISKPKMTDYGSFWLSILSIVLVVVITIIKRNAKKCSLSVTENRIWGCTAFGKQVDLPVDSVSAIGKSSFSSIAISTSSGSIKFVAIKNQSEIYDILNQLLINRQRKTYQSNPAVFSANNADELKKYKELLDMGVITQAEFDAKKNQLLGFNAGAVQPQPSQAYTCPNCNNTVYRGDQNCKTCGAPFSWN